MDHNPSEGQKTIKISGLATSLAVSVGPSRGLVLNIESGSKQGQRILVGQRILSIGAGNKNQLVLDDPTVSREHAQIAPARNGVLLKDLGSSNGTRVGGALIREVLVPVGGEFCLGETKIRLLDGGAPQIPPSNRQRFGGMVGASVAMREVFAVLELASPSDATVLLQGGSGCGKELAARAIHDHSTRNAGPFVVFDAGSTSRELLQSALFGHKKGAFTGAVADRPGAFVEAEGGTLFLDEIGELPLESQTHLLRALESKQVIPVGGDRARPVNARVVAATNRDLFSMVEDKTFRLDLFHRLAVVHVRLPNLSDRLEDIPALIQHFYEGRSEKPGVIGGPNLDLLRSHPFAGNVRELRNILERSLVLTAGSHQFNDLKLWLGPQMGSPPSNSFNVDTSIPYKEAKETVIDSFEARYLPDLMARFNNNVSQAAKHSGLSRRHLRALLVKHGLVS